MVEDLHVWLPELPGSNGGIQIFSGHLLAALQESEQVANIRVIVKNDPIAPSTLSSDKIKYYTAGRWPAALRTIAFVVLAAMLGIKNRPSLIFVGHPSFAPAAAILRRLFGIPYWVVAYGIEVWNLPLGSIRTALIGADRVLPISGFTKSHLLAQLPLALERITILPMTMDPHRFTIGPKPGYLLKRHKLRADQPVILTVARMAESERYKGYDRMLHALPAVRQAIPDAHYVIGGRGTDRNRVERLIEELGLSDCVTLAGFIADDELADYYRLSDVFAMPSKGEGFGIVYLEAMACGKPVLAGNKDGSVDALRGGELGALVDPDDVNEIGSTLVQLLRKTYSHPWLFQPEMLRNAVLACFGPDRFRERVTSLLDEFSKRP